MFIVINVVHCENYTEKFSYFFFYIFIIDNFINFDVQLKYLCMFITVVILQN